MLSPPNAICFITLVIYLVLQKLQAEIFECYLKGKPSPEWHQHPNLEKVIDQVWPGATHLYLACTKSQKIHLTSSKCSSKASGFDRPHHIIIILTLLSHPC